MEFTIQKTTCCWIPHSHILMFNQDWNAGPLSKYTTNGFKAKICTFFSIRLWRFILCENWTDSNLQDFSTWIFHQISQKNIARRNILKLMTCFPRLLCLGHVCYIIWTCYILYIQLQLVEVEHILTLLVSLVLTRYKCFFEQHYSEKGWAEVVKLTGAVLFN